MPHALEAVKVRERRERREEQRRRQRHCKGAVRVPDSHLSNNPHLTQFPLSAKWELGAPSKRSGLRTTRARRLVPTANIEGLEAWLQRGIVCGVAFGCILAVGLDSQ